MNETLLPIEIFQMHKEDHKPTCLVLIVDKLDTSVENVLTLDNQGKIIIIYNLKSIEMFILPTNTMIKSMDMKLKKKKNMKST